MKTPDFSKNTVPTMGWSSWNSMGMSVTEEGIMRQMDAMVELGLADAGYEYINIDDCWQNGRDELTGRVNHNPEKFPHGMKYIADEAHKRGLKAGIYSDGGDNTCASSSGRRPYGRGVGLWQHEEDLWMYLGDGVYRDKYARENSDDPGVECWGYDFIKVDWCGGRDHNLNAEVQYTLYNDVINEIERAVGKDKIFNLCCWGYYGPWMLRVGDYWRCGIDLLNFDTVLTAIDSMKSLGRFSIPGHYADPDMLYVGNGLTAAENRLHFAMWCMFSTPLVLGCDMTKMKAETVSLVTNRELIEINRDPMAKCASCIGTLGDSVEVWFKKIIDPESGDGVLALINRSKKEQCVTFDFSEVCRDGMACGMRDVIACTDLGDAESITVTIAEHDIFMIRFTTGEGYVKKDFAAVTEDKIKIGNSNPDIICGPTVKQYVKNYGALLIDVRSPEEYAAGHIEGAINIQPEMLVYSTDILPKDQFAHIIVYCEGQSRSRIAFTELKQMKYKNVYCLQSMESYYTEYGNGK